MKKTILTCLFGVCLLLVGLFFWLWFPREPSLRLKGVDHRFMRLIPGGSFIAGSGQSCETTPPYLVQIKSFYLDETEVTVEAFQKFLVDTNYLPEGDFQKRMLRGQEQHPVTGVTWNDAQAYAKWAGKRLPTEFEWEYAAGGPEKTRYAWGNEWQQDNEALWSGERKTSAPVGSYPPNPYGLFDMTGNVTEWTQSFYQPYPGGRYCGGLNERYRVVKGGCFRFFEQGSDRHARHLVMPDKFYELIGFRCAKDML